MKLFVVQFLLAFFVLEDQSVPYKEKDEFAIEVNLMFKHRPQDSAIHPNDKGISPLLPYLTLHLKLLSCSEQELHLRVEDNQRTKLVSKKANVNSTTKLDIGFTDDIKAGVISQEYVAYLSNKQKQRMSKIVISFDKAGNYYVNGDLHGRI